jgi:drug/metabolite transporter (DMT)-like permease
MSPYNRRVNAIGPGLGALCALASGLTWAVINLMVRRLVPPFNSVSINALRTTAAGALLLAWVTAAGHAARLVSIPAGDLFLLALSIVLASSIGDTVFFESTPRIGLAPALTISMTYPLMATIFAALALGEPVTPRMLMGSVLTLGGLGMIVVARGGVARGGTGFALGFACAVVASLAWALSAIVLKAPLRDIDAVLAQAIRMPIAGLLLFATPWARGTVGVAARGGRPMLWRLGALCVLTVLSATLFTAGLKYAGVAMGTVLSSTAPMWAVPLGYVGLGERLPALALAGLVVTVLGIAVLQL